MGGRARKAQEYSYELCRAMCRGFSKQKAYDRSGKACTGTMRRSAFMAFITSVRCWQEPSSESGKVLSPVRSPSSVGFVPGEEEGDRMISESRATGRVFAASPVGDLLGGGSRRP